MDKETTLNRISDFLGMIGHYLFAGWILMLVWNAIAWEYNQPQFGYWVCVGFYWLVRCVFSPFKRGK